MKIAFLINYHIFWFQISINDFLVMQIFKRDKKRTYIKSTLIVVKNISLAY